MHRTGRGNERIAALLPPGGRCDGRATRASSKGCPAREPGPGQTACGTSRVASVPDRARVVAVRRATSTSSRRDRSGRSRTEGTPWSRAFHTPGTRAGRSSQGTGSAARRDEPPSRGGHGRMWCAQHGPLPTLESHAKPDHEPLPWINLGGRRLHPAGQSAEVYANTDGPRGGDEASGYTLSGVVGRGGQGVTDQQRPAAISRWTTRHADSLTARARAPGRPRTCQGGRCPGGA